jgi:hypothetical protein
MHGRFPNFRRNPFRFLLFFQGKNRFWRAKRTMLWSFPPFDRRRIPDIMQRIH